MRIFSIFENKKNDVREKDSDFKDNAPDAEAPVPDMQEKIDVSVSKADGQETVEAEITP